MTVNIIAKRIINIIFLLTIIFVFIAYCNNVKAENLNDLQIEYLDRFEKIYNEIIQIEKRDNIRIKHGVVDNENSTHNIRKKFLFKEESDLKFDVLKFYNGEIPEDFNRELKRVSSNFHKEDLVLQQEKGVLLDMLNVKLEKKLQIQRNSSKQR